VISRRIVMSAARPSRAPSRRLPEHPNLEQLRKQAKDLLQAFRSGDTAAEAEIRLFERNPDAARFGLSDAQRIIARAYGFASWPKLKAFVDGASIARFAEFVKAGDIVQVRSMLATRSELVGMDRSANDEHRAIHYAVLNRDAAMARLLMEAGADARKGIYPHRDATTAMALAQDRDYADIVAVIEEEECHRREEMSCINATVSPIQDQISTAIANGDSATAMRLIESDLSVIHACDRNGTTPLHIAARAGDADLVAWLLQRRAGARKKDPNGLTPLDYAALAADPRNRGVARFPALAQLLLQHGSEMTVRAAVALGDEAAVRTMLHDDPTLLHQIGNNGGLVTLAVNHHQLEVVSLLLDLGADVDERILFEELEDPTESWGMPLWYAALAGDLAMTRLLLDRGADPNANVYASGWPLRNAWNHEDPSVKNLLLERGARPQPYMISETHNVAEAKKLLAENASEDLAQEFLVSAADYGCSEIVDLALPLLHWPLNDSRWHWVIIQPIRGAGSDSAKNAGQFKCMAALLQYGIDPNVARAGHTALHFAAARHSGLSGDDRARFAAMLLDHGARLDLRDDLLKSTPLGWACRWGQRELVELFLSRGAPVHEADTEPWATPIAWATKMKQSAILGLLERHSSG
jgi:ankyrin repeat protein